MTDREKIIKALECCKEKTCDYSNPKNVCPYLKWCGEYEDSCYDCTTRLATDVLELLKDQQNAISALRVINDGLTEAVLEQNQIVRCKDCKNRGTYSCFRILEDEDGEITDLTFDDGFCDSGERREQQNDNDQQHS